MDVKLISDFKLHKSESKRREYEDARKISRDVLRIAIADGATSACFSKIWAEILVKYFVKNPTKIISNEWLEDCYNTFSKKIDIYSLPWNAKLKMIRDGSLSTLAGLIINRNNREYFGIAVGDSCLFGVDDEETHLFPIETPEMFSNRTKLISSLRDKNIDISSKQRVVSRKLIIGRTRFYLLTDALACWFVSDYIKNGSPWNTLDSINNQKEFTTFVKKQRNENAIKDDDTTLIIIEITNPGDIDSNAIPTNE